MIKRLKTCQKLQYLNLYFLIVLLFSLPIAHVTSIQNIALLCIILISFTNIDQESFKKFLTFKVFLSAYFLMFILGLISIHYSIQPKTTISEIRSEFIKPFIILMCIYFYTFSLDFKRLTLVFTIICCTLFSHTIANILLWIYDGGWPARAGGFLDGTIDGFRSGGGERFGIYATYSLAISLSLFFTKYKKIAFVFLILSFISIVANNTRATFIGMFFIFGSYYLFIHKNSVFKYLVFFLAFISITSFIFYSKNLHTRYNIYNMCIQMEYLTQYSPSEYEKLIQEHNLGFSAVSRLAMWKSALLYRLEYPFKPLGYGRFLYGKQIKDLWKDKSQNLPFIIFDQLHNDFMSMLFSLGFLGLIAFIGILSWFFKISYYIYCHSKLYKFMGVFLFLGMSGHIASMLFGSFFGDSEQIYFYILYGFAITLFLKTKEEDNETITSC